MANRASLAGLEFLSSYHQTLVLPNSSQPTVSQYFCALETEATAVPKAGPESEVGHPVHRKLA
jgi:hypothetical protein